MRLSPSRMALRRSRASLAGFLMPPKTSFERRRVGPQVDSPRRRTSASKAKPICWHGSMMPVGGASDLPACPNLPTSRRVTTMRAGACVIRGISTSWPADRRRARRRRLRAAAPSSRSVRTLRAHRACLQAVDAIEASGVRVDQRAALAELDAIGAHALVVLQVEAARVHRACIEDPGIPAVLRKRLVKGLDDATLATSLSVRETLSSDFTVFGAADAIILPVMPIRVPLAVETDPASDKFSPATLYALGRFTRFVNFLGFPAVAIPAGFDDRGLPVALQIVGRPYSDRTLLALAQAVQDRTDWHARVPA